MYRGRYQQGQEIPLGVLCADASFLPTAPDDCPVMEVFNSAGTVVEVMRIPVLDRYGTTGLFGYNLFLGADYSAGQYRVVYTYTLASSTYWGLEEDSFDVVAGGHEDGAAISVFFYHRPNADFVVQQLTSGKIVRGRNPKL